MRRPPSIRRVFLEWLAGPGSAHAGHIVLKGWTGRMLTFWFDRGHPFLLGSLRESSLEVWAHLNGEYWDMVLDLDVAPVHAGDGWHCDLCQQPRQSLPTREALWRDHLFDPLGEWMASTLIPAKALAFFGYGGATAARLMPSTADLSTLKATFLVPLPGPGGCNQP